MTDPELIEAACKASIRWNLDPAAAARLGQQDTAAAIRGIAGAAQEDDPWWHAIHLATHFPSEDLRAAGLDEDLVSRVEASQAAANYRASHGQGPEPEPAGERFEEPETPPTLAQLVGGDMQETETALLGGFRELASQVDGLNEEQRSRLAERVASWWPTEPYADTITWEEPHRWRQQYGAAAWLSYTAALKTPISVEEWAQVVSGGVAFEPEREWLRKQCSQEGQIRVAEILAGNPNPDRWLTAFDCCPSELAKPLMTAAVDAIGGDSPAAEWLSADEELRARGLLIERLIANAHTKLAERVARGRPELAATFDTKLAQHGDVEAQIRITKQLVERARDGDPLQHDEFQWMSTISDEALLDPLFELLGLVWATSDKPIPRVSSGIGIHNVTNPVIGAIGAIGGQLAVEGYDRLLSDGGDLRWLRQQRDDIAGNMLRIDGLESAGAAAEQAAVPALTPSIDELSDKQTAG